MIIALLDANPVQAEKLAAILKDAGQTCRVFGRAADYFAWLQTAQCDLLLLNSAMDDAPPVEVLSNLRKLPGARIPVLLMVESPDSEAIVSLMAAGLDDYCMLPALQASELLLRVQVLLRRAWPERISSLQLAVGPFVFDKLAMRLTVNGRTVTLTQMEYELALLLFQHLGQPVSRATILDAVWGLGADVDPDFRSVDTHIARIRRKLNLRADSEYRLTSVYGYGYVLEQAG